MVMGDTMKVTHEGQKVLLVIGVVDTGCGEVCDWEVCYGLMAGKVYNIRTDTGA
jgi:hypothetical protein